MKKLNYELIQRHRQLHENSCIPMSIECILKLLKLMPANDFLLQTDPTKSGNSDWVKGFRYPAIKPEIQFSREFKMQDEGYNEDRGVFFMKKYYDKLFKRIDEELSNERFVIISLKSGPNEFHMEVIHNKIDDSFYETFTFFHTEKGVRDFKHNLKSRVADIKGTDILTYKYIEHEY